MTEEYIKKADAVRTVLEKPDMTQDEKAGIVRRLQALPTANVVEVRYCRFSLEEARRRESVYKCSACGYYLTVRADTLNGGRADMNYCPFCGRKVIHKWQDGGQNE
jgi:predicted RNA-binding Zn-ribbon protein involved in translation (DUF1610 family)